MSSSANAQLHKARHIKYWTRCIKTFLPHQYTGNDSNRMYLAFLTVSALDILDSLTTACPEEERRDYINWIYRCQHPNGGFRMWPGTDMGERRNDANAKWDPANVPGTYFALATLLILADDFKRVRRKETLQWLRKMQREDGSFGETLVDGHLEGGRDPRQSYCATGVRYMLRARAEGPMTIESEEVHDIDVDALVHCVRAAESYDGGIADEDLHEPHAGYTFCALGALNFVNRLKVPAHAINNATLGPTNPREVVRWLVHRQTDLSDPDSMLDSEFLGASLSLKSTQSVPTRDEAANPLYQTPEQSVIAPALEVDTECAGMNGRTNKVADTCYAWWVGASLRLLGQPHLCDQSAMRQYLLQKTQHPILGGFGKFPGDVPDVYHSYLGLAALSLAGDADVKELDAAMCISKEASGRLRGLWREWNVDGGESISRATMDAMMHGNVP